MNMDLEGKQSEIRGRRIRELRTEVKRGQDRQGESRAMAGEVESVGRA